MRVWFKAVKHYKEYPIESSPITAKFYNISPQEYRKQIEGLKWIGYEGQMKDEHSERRTEVFRIICDIKFSSGRITRKPDAKESINITLLKELYENSK